MKKWYFLVIALGVPALSATAAYASPPSVPPGLARAEQAMSSPASMAQLHSQQATVQPMVDNVVAQAKATGNPAAVQALIDNTHAPGSPAVHAAILQDTGQYDVTSPTTYASGPPILGAGGVDPCYGYNDGVYTRHYWGAIYTAGWISVVSSGWCGDGNANITWFGGFWGREWVAPGYCFTSEAWNTGSWIAYWWWVHGGHWAQIGIDIPFFGCASLSSGSATIREWPNGYWDTNY